MRKKEENPIKKFIYKHKKIFKYLLLFFRIALIILIGRKFGIIGQDGNGAISHSDNLFYSWEFVPFDPLNPFLFNFFFCDSNLSLWFIY